MTEKIRPCPFCGASDMVERPVDNYNWVLYCNQCEYQSPLEEVLQDAIDAHNYVSVCVQYAKDMGRTPEVLAILEKERIK